MRVVKKEKFYINSLNTPLPELPASQTLPKIKDKNEFKTLKELKHEIFKQRLIDFKGNVFHAAKSLRVNRNIYSKTLGSQFIKKTKEELRQDKKLEFIKAFNETEGNIKILSKKLNLNKSTAHNMAVFYGLIQKKPKITSNKTLKPKQLNLF